MTADLDLINGTIWIGDDERTTASRLSIRDGLIAAWDDTTHEGISVIDLQGSDTVGDREQPVVVGVEGVQAPGFFAFT